MSFVQACPDHCIRCGNRDVAGLRASSLGAALFMLCPRCYAYMRDALQEHENYERRQRERDNEMIARMLAAFRAADNGTPEA